jgi:hypothetical protein
VQRTFYVLLRERDDALAHVRFQVSQVQTATKTRFWFALNQVKLDQPKAACCLTDPCLPRRIGKCWTASTVNPKTVDGSELHPRA